MKLTRCGNLYTHMVIEKYDEAATDAAMDAAGADL